MILRGSYGVWIIGCVACLIAFMFVFFSSQKTVFKKLARHLAICWASKFCFLSQFQHLLDTWWIDRESSCLLDSFSIARLINWASVLDMVVCSLTHAWHLHLLTAIFLTPTSIDFLTSLNTFICRDLLMAYIFSSCDPQLIFVDLSLDTSVFSSSLFKIFFTW